MTISRLTNSGLYSLTEYTGLENIGGWASVTAATGTFTKGSYTDADGQWTYWQWTGAGSVTATAGLVDALVIGGGTYNHTTYNGNSGNVLRGIFSLSATTHAVAVGSGGVTTDEWGRPSSVGALNSGIAVEARNVTDGYGAGATQLANGPLRRQGIFSSITGSSVEYSSVVAAAPAANLGQASYSTSSAYSGGSGVAIIRVPTAFDLT